MESGGVLPLLRSTAAGESWESGEEWGEGAVRGGEANNCRRFGKQRGFSSVAARMQPRRPRAPLGPGPRKTADSNVPREPGPGVL